MRSRLCLRTWTVCPNRYVYEFCPFENVTQTEARGKRDRFLLGLWSHWHSNVDCDNDLVDDSEDGGIIDGAPLPSTSTPDDSRGHSMSETCRHHKNGLSRAITSSSSSSSGSSDELAMRFPDWSRMVYTDGDNCSDFGPRRTVVEMQCGASGSFSVGEVSALITHTNPQRS